MASETLLLWRHICIMVSQMTDNLTIYSAVYIATKGEMRIIGCKCYDE